MIYLSQIDALIQAARKINRQQERVLAIWILVKVRYLSAAH
jgi:hypothetical protein